MSVHQQNLAETVMRQAAAYVCYIADDGFAPDCDGPRKVQMVFVERIIDWRKQNGSRWIAFNRPAGHLRGCKDVRDQRQVRAVLLNSAHGQEPPLDYPRRLRGSQAR